MTAGIQKQIIRTTGVSLSTMLLLTLTQMLVQVLLLFDLSQLMMLFLVIFPIIALLCGIACEVLTGNIWCTVIAAAAAFTMVLLVLYQGEALMYTPLYVAVSLLGYGAAYVLRRKKKSGAVAVS